MEKEHIESPLGGQALIEGVLILSPSIAAMAVRTKKGIITKKEVRASLTKKHVLLGLPIIRGVITLFEMLVIGYRALQWSADVHDQRESSAWEKTGAIIFAAVVALGLFVLAPYALAASVSQKGSLLFNFVDGVFRVFFFVLYIGVIGLMKDVRRTFQYHGAEHQAVHCAEEGLALTPKNVARFSPLHPRCGTSFLLFVVILSIAVFSLLPSVVWYISILERIVVLPLIAGVSYELLRKSAGSSHIFWRIMIGPGLWLQKLTTRKPSKSQIEVAIAAVKLAREKET